MAIVGAAATQIGIVVITSAEPKYRDRVRLARETWARPRSSPVLFVKGAHGDPGASNDFAEDVNCTDDHLQGMCCKTVEGIRLALQRFPAARWIVRAVDDTYIFPGHLAEELGVLQSTRLVYVGAVVVSLLCHFALHAGACGEAHAGGGAGAVFSRPLAELLVRHAGAFLEHCFQDDLHMGHFFRHVFDVHVMSLPGVIQEPRITSLTGFEHSSVSVEAPPRCPIPLPQPVYARIDDWGPVHPFAPMNAKRLILLHSDVALWPTLHRLSVDMEKISADVEYMAYFAGGGDRRVMGPRHESRGQLGFCVFRGRADRLASFQLSRGLSEAAAEPVPVLATLHWAAWHGHVETVRELCAAGTNVNEQRVRSPVQEELSALHLAAMKGHIGAVEELLKQRANPSIQATLSGWTPLDVARFAAVNGYTDQSVVDKLGTVGANFAQSDVELTELSAVAAGVWHGSETEHSLFLETRFNSD